MVISTIVITGLGGVLLGVAACEAEGQSDSGRAWLYLLAATSVLILCGINVAGFVGANG